MSEEKYRDVECDDLKLLRLLCKMANMSQAGVQKAVLVCEVDKAPVIYVQSLLQPVDEAAEAELLEVGRGVGAERVNGIMVDAAGGLDITRAAETQARCQIHPSGFHNFSGKTREAQEIIRCDACGVAMP